MCRVPQGALTLFRGLELILHGLYGEVGTILGPNGMGEWLIIRGGALDEDLLPIGVRLGYAYPQELQEVLIGLVTGVREPQSMAEFKLKRSQGIG